MFEIKGLSKSFGEKEVLKNKNLQLNKGEIVGLLGKNGAGKTTLIKSINNLYKYKGSITINNKSYKDDPNYYLNNIGILLEPSYYDYLTALENMKIVCSFNKNVNAEQRAMELLDFIGLKDAANRKVSGFSFGMKQRLGVAMALSNNPELLILDEPTIGVDPKGLEILKDRLTYLAKKEKKTILFSSNDLNEMQKWSDRIILLKDGEIVEDRSRKSIIEDGNQYTITVKSPFSNSELNQLKNQFGCLVLEKNRVKIIDNNKLNPILNKIILSKNNILDIERNNSILENFYK